MQKKIIALAVAAAFSTPAFADVGFYGIVDAAVASVSAKNQKSDFLALSGSASTSRLGVKATEDIGNGLTAVAVVEYGIDTQDINSTLTARQKMLAVAGDFGTVATGYLQTAAYDFLAKYDPIYGSSSSAHTIASSGHLVGNLAARAPRAVAYISPNINGLVFAANYSTSYQLATPALGRDKGNLTVADTTTAGLKATAYILSANYAVDALSVGAVYASETDTSSGGATLNEFSLGGSYDLGVAKVMGTYQSQKSNAAGAKADTVFSLAGVVPVATGAVAVMYGSSKVADSAASGANALTAGYLHTFTKSTTGYVVFSNVKNGSGTASYSVAGNGLVAGWGAASATNVNNGASSTLFGVGLRKKF